MPNWVQNEVTITGDYEKRSELFKLMQSENCKFDYNNIIKMPEELSKVNKGGEKINGKMVERWFEVDGKNVEIDEDTLERFKKDYGALDWFDWSIINWGCKWNNRDDVDAKHERGRTVYRFDSPWSMPMGVYIVLSRKFPELEFNIWASEESGAFEGNLIMQNGEILEDNMAPVNFEDSTT